MIEKIENAVEALEKYADKGRIIDVSKGSEKIFGLTPCQMAFVKQKLREDGYNFSIVLVNKLGEENVKTAIHVLYSPDKDDKYVQTHKHEIVAFPNTPIKKALRIRGIVSFIEKARKDGMSYSKIGECLNIAESTIRNLVRLYLS